MTYTILTRGNVHSSGRGSIGPRVLTLEWPQAAPATSTTQRRAVASGSCHIPVVANLKEREVAFGEMRPLGPSPSAAGTGVTAYFRMAFHEAHMLWPPRGISGYAI